MTRAEIAQMIAALRAEIGIDPHSAKRYAVKVACPSQFGVIDQVGGSLRDTIHVGGFTARKDAADAAPTILVEVAGKMLAAVLTPGQDPPPCETAVGRLHIRLRD
jgi:hypothetical protein